MKKVCRVVSDVLFYLVIAAVLLGSFAFAANKNPNETFFGYRAYNVLSGSMQPTLHKGDLVVVKATPPQEIQIGDVLTYYPNEQGGAVVTHRVVHTMLDGDQLMLQTQGDAVDQPDPPFPADAAIGVMAFHIPMVGGVVSWIQHRPLLALLAAGAVLLFIRLPGKLLKKEQVVQNRTE